MMKVHACIRENSSKWSPAVPTVCIRVQLDSTAVSCIGIAGTAPDQFSTHSSFPA